MLVHLLPPHIGDGHVMKVPARRQVSPLHAMRWGRPPRTNPIVAPKTE